jgi:surfactin synthase thioesterase subunit
MGLVLGLLPEIRSLGAAPKVFFGHSMGALVAYELCKILHRDHSEDTNLLVVSGRPSPTVDLVQGFDPYDDGSIMGEVSKLGTELNDFSPGDITELFLPALRADYKALTTYRFTAGEPLSCAIWVFYGRSDPYVTPEGAYEWARCTRGQISIETFEGGHFYFRDDSSLLGQAIRRAVTLTLHDPGV